MTLEDRACHVVEEFQRVYGKPLAFDGSPVGPLNGSQLRFIEELVLKQLQEEHASVTTERDLLYG